ncbi:MAG: hypothetical protein ACREAB_05725, partial [Blastocatellia bacterium]
MKRKVMFKSGWIAFGIVVLIALIALAALPVASTHISYPMQAPAPADPVVINFDDLAAGGPGTPATVTVLSQYADKGVTFNGPVALDYSKGLSLRDFARSGNIAIEQCHSQEFCTKPIEMSFTRSQRRVKVWVGYSNRLDESRMALLRAFNASNAEVGRGTAILNPSLTAQPIRTPLEVTSSSNDIRRVVVSFSPDTIFMNDLAIDDIEFDTAGPPPDCASATAPSVTLSQPTGGETAQVNEFILQGAISAPSGAPLTAATLTVTGASGVRRPPDFSIGGASRSLDLLAGGLVTGGGGAFGPIRVNELLFPGVNTITVAAQNCHGAGSISRIITFAPIASDARIVFLGLEITQAIQDLNNSVPIIADKRTLVRVYLRGEGASEIRNVSGALTGCRPLGDTALCGDFFSNLRSLNSITINSSGDVEAKRQNLAASLNFELPPEWTTAGRIHLRLSNLEIAGSRLYLPCEGCDNPNPIFPAFPRYYEFHQAPPVSFKLYNVSYDANGTTHSADFTHIHHLRSWIQRAYPTSEVIAPNIDFRSGLALHPVFGRPSCSRVNTDLFINKVLSNYFGPLIGFSDEEIYYGMVDDGGGFMRGCAKDKFTIDLLLTDIEIKVRIGSGPTGSPSSQGYDWDKDKSYGDFYGGHEIGHLHGRHHPGFIDGPGGTCIQGEQDDSPVDRNFPYPLGSIGKIGWDAGDASLGIPSQLYLPYSATNP